MANEIVKKLMEVERRAKQIIAEADNRKMHIEEEINSEISKMNDDYISRANARVEKVVSFEEELAAEKSEKLRKDTDERINELKKKYNENKEKWLDELYKKVIG